MSAKILLVEDDINLGFIVQDQLKSLGYTVHLSTDGKDGLQQFHKTDYHLCIFDVMMPKKDGFSLAQDIRKINKDVPILFLTAKSMTEDKIKGFQSGGDDYLTKPFSMDEFTLRVKALLKRSNADLKDQNETVFKIGTFTYDSENFVLSHKDLEDRKLTQKEAKVLKILCQNINKVLPKDIILNSVWGQDDYFVGRSLDVYISKLRKYLSADQFVSIENVHGVGLKLIG